MTQGQHSHNGPGLFCGRCVAAPAGLRDTPATIRPASFFEDDMKRTFQPSNLVRARRHGFFARKATPGGQKVLRARRNRGRKKLCA